MHALSPTKRLNINLPTSAYEELRLLANDSGRTMTEVVRGALALALLEFEERGNDRSLAVVSKDDRVLKRLVML